MMIQNSKERLYCISAIISAVILLLVAFLSNYAQKEVLSMAGYENMSRFVATLSGKFNVWLILIIGMSLLLHFVAAFFTVIIVNKIALNSEYHSIKLYRFIEMVLFVFGILVVPNIIGSRPGAGWILYMLHAAFIEVLAKKSFVEQE